MARPMMLHHLVDHLAHLPVLQYLRDATDAAGVDMIRLLMTSRSKTNPSRILLRVQSLP